jgi:hypothetical protein
MKINYFVYFFCRILLKEAIIEIRKQITANPSESVSFILSSVAKKLPPDLLEGPKLDNLRRAAQRARKRILDQQAEALSNAEVDAGTASSSQNSPDPKRVKTDNSLWEDFGFDSNSNQEEGKKAVCTYLGIKNPKSHPFTLPVNGRKF